MGSLAGDDSSEPRRDAAGVARTLRPLENLEILGRLGVGGMAEIFLARRLDPARTSRAADGRAVVKRLHPSLASDADLTCMFLDEARLGMRLTHPGLCRFYAVGELAGQPSIAMEFIDGVTLEALSERAERFGGLPIALSLGVALDAARALESLHGARDARGHALSVVHRDVSPRNLMVAYDGEVKLLDFGLAKCAANRSITQPGTAKGTFAYLAPELWGGGLPDVRADVFSLGVCLFEAITGRPLYQYSRPLDARAAIVSDPVPSARARRGEVPLVVDAVIQRALSKRPEDRFASAREFAGALEDAAEQTVPSAPTPPEDGGAQGSRREFLRRLFWREIVAGPDLEPSELELSTPRERRRSRGLGGRRR